MAERPTAPRTFEAVLNPEDLALSGLSPFLSPSPEEPLSPEEFFPSSLELPLSPVDLAVRGPLAEPTRSDETALRTLISWPASDLPLNLPLDQLLLHWRPWSPPVQVLIAALADVFRAGKMESAV